MEREAASAGIYETGGMKVPRLQILTAAEILDKRRPQVPFGFTEGFRKAEQERKTGSPSYFDRLCGASAKDNEWRTPSRGCRGRRGHVATRTRILSSATSVSR
jgi:hypothetical protein